MVKSITIIVIKRHHSKAVVKYVKDMVSLKYHNKNHDSIMF